MSPDESARTGLPIGSEPARSGTSDGSLDTPRGTAIPLIIVIGSSAGGIKALETIFRQVQQLPPQQATAAAYIVIQHASASAPNTLAAILQRATRLAVCDINDGMPLHAGRVHVRPPGMSLGLVGGILRLTQPASPLEAGHPIDGFLSVLAAGYGARTVGVILSGSGSDGTAGARALQAADGLVAVQDPATASSEGMPRSVVEAGLAHVVAPLEQLPQRIHEALAARPAAGARGRSSRVADVLPRILQAVKAHTGHDFTTYKTSTLMRRIERQMNLRRVDDPEDYLQLLAGNPSEARALIREFLIGVTRFFRDPEIWEQVQAEVVPAILAGLPAGGMSAGASIRAWIPGCATGEDAYSLAMILLEELEHTPPAVRPTIQIFATDLNPQAIERARRGLYPPSIRETVGAERLGRFFTPHERGFRVASCIREVVTFAPHSLLSDPPFTRIDLLICRNLLIYLDPQVHEVLLPRFHYSLNPRGHLVLGSSESIGAAIDLFTPLTGNRQIYRRLDVPCQPRRLGFATRSAIAPDLPTSSQPHHSMSADDSTMFTAVNQILLQRFGPAALVLNAAGDVLHLSGRVEPFMTAAVEPDGRCTIALVRDGLREVLRETLAEALRSHATLHRRGEFAVADGPNQAVDLVVQPLREPDSLAGHALVIFVADVLDAPSATAIEGPRSEQQTARIGALEQELRRTRHELQLAREEMQASREELTTSAEELRTMNEELVRARAAAEQSLARYTDLFDSAPVGYFTLDHGGAIVQANSAGAALLGMDQRRLTGSPIGLFVREHDRGAFRACVQQAFANAANAAGAGSGAVAKAEVCEVALWREDAAPRIIRFSALAAEDGQTCRIVAVDVSEIRSAEAAVRERDETIRLTITASRLGLWQLDIVRNTVEWSAECKAQYGLPPDAEITLEMARAMVHPDDREANARLRRETIEHGRDLSHEYRVIWADGSVHWIAAMGRVYRDEHGRPLRMTGMMLDITARKESEKALNLERAKLRAAFENITTGVYVMDANGGNLWMNAAGRRLLDLPAEAGLSEVVAGYFAEFDLYDDAGRMLAVEEWPATRALHGEQVKEAEYTLTHRATGRARNCLVTAIPVHDAEGRMVLLVITAHDVTERHAAEQAGRAAQAIIKNLERALDEHALVSITDQTGRIIYANDKFCAVSKYAREDLLGQDHRIVNSGHHSKEFMRDLWETLIAGRTWKGEIRNLAQDGTLYWVETTIVPFLSPDGKPYQYVAIRNDITKRRNAETTLVQKQRFLQAVTDGFPGMVSHWTRELRCTFANQGYLAWFGKTPQQMIGIQLADLLGPKGFELSRSHLSVVLRGTPQVFHRTLVKANGDTGHVLAQLIPDTDGAVVKGFYTLLTDITPIKQAEQALRRSTELLESSQGLAQVGGWELAHGASTPFWTREMHRIHGTDAERHQPTVADWIARYVGDGATRFAAAIEQALTGGQGFDLELELEAADHARKWVHITCRAIGIGGPSAKIVGAVQDITERRTLQLALSQARDRALEASRLKSEFLSTMSHEIRTPMNGVIGITELLLETELDAQQQEMVGILRNSGENLLVIINDILDFSRIEAGKIRIDAATFVPRTVLDETIALLTPRAKEKGLRLSLQIDEALSQEVSGDGGRVRQVVINLVGNAIKFTEQGEVLLEAGVISEREGWCTVRIEVRDTGVGIPPEAQGRLFQPFTQGDGSFTRKHGGTGLGLAISRQLVELMGGTIGFSSTPGNGATFWFELTFAISRTPTPAPGPVVPQPSKRLRLLVADDNQANQKVVQMLLHTMGHTVDLCDDGTQALDLLSRTRYDAVLLDCQMPVLDGFETTMRIRSGADPAIDRNIPVIALTAAAMPEDRILTRKAGMNEHLTKPIRLPDLNAAFVRLGLYTTG